VFGENAGFINHRYICLSMIYFLAIVKCFIVAAYLPTVCFMSPKVNNGEHVMKQLIIKHISGSKANQVESFQIEKFNALIFGRDTDADIVFHPDQDDLVSRQHARLTCVKDDTDLFELTDLSSRNGILVNNKKIEDHAVVRHGDRVQLGIDGPEFVLELDPPPDTAVRATRIGVSIPGINPTRESMPTIPASSTVSSVQPRSIGRTTVERLIKDTSRKSLVNGGAIGLIMLALVTGVMLYQDITSKKDIEITRKRVDETTNAIEVTKKDVDKINAIMSPRQIADKYSAATVKIETSWKLISTGSGRQMYHYHKTLSDKESEVYKKARLPVYVQLNNGSIEPLLISESQNGSNKPIGSTGTGSGFVVADNGFILTNRHVAAPWLTTYNLPLPGLLISVNELYGVDFQDALKSAKPITQARGGLNRWVPARSQLYDGRNPRFQRLQ